MRRALLLLPLLLVGGCISLLPKPPPPPRVFALEASNVERVQGAPISDVITVGEPSGEDAIIGTSLVWRTGDQLASIAQTQWSDDASDALQAMLVERERLGTTAMGDGIAIPHARVESLDRVLAVFGLSRAGVDFDSLDGKPTHLFFLLVAPGREGSAHLLLLARLSRLLGAEPFRARLRDVKSTDELFRAIEEEESRH